MFLLVHRRYLNYLLLLAARPNSMERLSRGGFTGRPRLRGSGVTCRGVLVRRSTGDWSLFDSVLESGRKRSVKGVKKY